MRRIVSIFGGAAALLMIMPNAVANPPPDFGGDNSGSISVNDVFAVSHAEESEEVTLHAAVSTVAVNSEAAKVAQKNATLDQATSTVVASKKATGTVEDPRCLPWINADSTPHPSRV